MASISKIRSDSDRISNLPNNLITHILSFLSTKDAVKTSALSTSWNQQWTLLPVIRVGEMLYPTSRCSQSFVNFVNRVLLYIVTPLDLFQLTYGSYDSINVRDWISVALSRRVRQLHVSAAMPSSCCLPDSLYSNKTLVVLKLKGKFVLRVPEIISLDSLKIFHYETPDFDGGKSFSRLISGCPVLEELHIEGYLSESVKVLDISSVVLKRLTLIVSRYLTSHSYEVVLDTPNLRYLKHIDQDDVADDFHINTLHCLDTARIGLYMSDSDLEELDIDKLILARSLAKLVAAVSNVRFLDIETSFEALYCPELPNFELQKFPRLISLKIQPIISEAGLRLLKAFLQSSPELKYLSLHLDYSNEIWYPPTDVPFCVLYNLKVIEVNFYHPRDSLLSMVAYFLEETNCLEELIIRPWTEVTEHIEKFIKEVMMLPRASNSCKIVVP